MGSVARGEGGDRTETRTVYCSLHGVGHVNACEKFRGGKTSVSGQRLRIFMVKYDFCILLRRVTIVKIQLFQWIDLTG